MAATGSHSMSEYGSASVNNGSRRGPRTSVLNGIGISEHTVLVLTAFLITLSGRSLLSELGLGLGSSLVLVAARVDVLEPFSEAVLDGHDLGGRLVQEVVDLGLHLRVRLPVVLLDFDLRNPVLNLLDQLSEANLGRLARIIRSDFLRLFNLILLLNSNPFLLNNRFSGLLLASHLVDLRRHLVKLLVENLDDLFLIVLVDEISQSLDNGLVELVGKFLDRVVNILSFESFLKLVKTTLVSQDVLDILGVFLGNLLPILVLLGLIDGIVGNAEVSQESVSCDDLLLLGINVGSAALLSGRLLLVEFCNDVGELVLDSLILLQSASEGPTLGLELPQVARQLLVRGGGGDLVVLGADVGLFGLSFRIYGLRHIK